MAALEFVVFGTIALGVIAWAAAEVARSRLLWTAGAILTLVHSASAFVVFYDGSHVVARAATTQRTADLTGLALSGGIYINYLFLVVWTGDAAWWCLAPRSYSNRGRWLSLAIRGFIFFIMLNGALIFADGYARVLGFVAVSAVILGVWHRDDTSDTAEPVGVWHPYDRSDTPASQ